MYRSIGTKIGLACTTPYLTTMQPISPLKTPGHFTKNWYGLISAKVRHGMAHATPESASPPLKQDLQCVCVGLV